MCDSVSEVSVDDGPTCGVEDWPASTPFAATFPVTFFKTYAADAKSERSINIGALADEISATTAPTKSALPWLKLARFGDQRTEKHSLRHDANVLAITGIEADYDGEKVAFDVAVRKLTNAGVLAIVYTSPSHRPDAPRWRILCPTSTELPPERRRLLMGRLNGLFGGIFSAESWTLSQSYYFGSVAGNPHHQVELIDGTPIDEHDELDEIWIGKPGTKKACPDATIPIHRLERLDTENALTALAAGENYHQSTVRLAGQWASSGVSYVDARARLLVAFDQVPDAGRDLRWQQRRGDIDRCLEDIYGKQAAKRDAVAPEGDDQDPPEIDPVVTAEAWLTREIEKPEPLFGEVITNTTRIFIGGATGIGKSHLAMGIAAGMATGQGFAHWPASRRTRILYIDGEMARDLVQERLIDVKRRVGGVDLSELYVLCREDFPTMQPLNTDAGRAFLLAKTAAWKIEVVIFDNRMSLLLGDMKEEQPWTDTMELVKELTRQRIAQIWIDHTGHDGSRIYGTKTKEWTFDAVMLLTKVERERTDIAFQIEFTKARRRRPDTRSDFETVVLILTGDHWTVEGADPLKSQSRLSPMCQQFYEAFVNALCVSPTPGEATRAGWYAECARMGLASAIEPDDTASARDRKQSRFRKYLAELKAARLIGVDGDRVFDLRKRPK